MKQPMSRVEDMVKLRAVHDIIILNHFSCQGQGAAGCRYTMLFNDQISSLQFRVEHDRVTHRMHLITYALN